MNEEIDESEFYHQDFTTASDWEIFIARIEEIINQWSTEEKQGEDKHETYGIWIIKTEKICFAEFEFNLQHYRKSTLDAESPTEDNDNGVNKTESPMHKIFNFELFDADNSTTHTCLSQWYGLDEFMVISPVKNVGVTTESRIKILLSSIYVVSSNLNFGIPIFIQIQEKWQECYLGVYEGERIRTNFEMVHLKRGPPHCQYLTGLLDLFKTKIMSPINIETITVSVQLTYTINNFGDFTWKRSINQHEDADNFSLLPFGVSHDPVCSMIIKTFWSHLPDHLIVDSESYSDFDPMQAPNWSLLVKFNYDQVCLLSDALTEFQHLFQNNTNIFQILGDYASVPLPENNPLDVLTEPVVPTISSLLSRAARNSLTRNLRGVPPIEESVLVPLLYFLFPDADEQTKHPYGNKDNVKEDVSEQNDILKSFETDSKGIKSCSMDSLVWRLAKVLVHTLQSLGGVRAFAHIWYEFVQEMRYRWEKSMPVPGLTGGFPDMRTCLLNQKLQMLNCCIERKCARENHQSLYDSAEDGSSTEDEDDEYFDCSEKPDDELKRREKYSLWNQPVGRLGKFGDMKLLKTGDPLYIPITQEPVIKTEDQLEEDTDVLLKLGSNAEATELRARIMSASLLSDMESFKAANPGSIVEDFIRWYSPRDWIESDELDEWGQKKGVLSPRMLIDDNIWVQTWESAKPVPANRQKRLFDDTREAEKVLQFLDYQTVSQVCDLITPVLSHAAIYRLVQECQLAHKELGDVSSMLSPLIKHAERISRDTKLQSRRFESFIQEVSTLELIISQINSLKFKLNSNGSAEDLSSFINKLVNGKEIIIDNGSNSEIGKTLLTILRDTVHIKAGMELTSGEITTDTSALENPFPTPTEREFVMRVNAVRPASYSSKCPQFLRAILSRNEFRLVGAFSEDIVFF